MKLDINTKNGYILATALRGPDANYRALKWIITGWIRAQCIASARYSMVRRSMLNKQDIINAKSAVTELYQQLWDYKPLQRIMLHWVMHCSQAIELLGNGDKESRWLLCFLVALGALLRNPSLYKVEEVHRWLDNYQREVTDVH